MKKQFFFIAIAIVSFLIVNYLPAQENNDEINKEIYERIHAADMKSDFKLYMDNHSFLERALSVNPENFLAKYHLAYTEYKLFQLKQANPNVAVDKYYDSAVEICKGLIEKKQLEGESKTILASLYMMRLSENQMEAMSLMPTIFELLEEAEAAPGSNPRAIIVKGIMQFYMPPMVGGSVEKSLESFIKAVSLFEDGKQNSQIKWGHEEAYAWLGQAYAKLNQADKALAAYNKALALDGEFAWVKYRLLPELTKENKN